jgi:hypothetical protein
MRDPEHLRNPVSMRPKANLAPRPMADLWQSTVGGRGRPGGYAAGVIGDDPGRIPSSGLAELAGQLLAVLDEFSADIAGQIRERVMFYAGDSIVSAEDAAAPATAKSCGRCCRDLAGDRVAAWAAVPAGTLSQLRVA